MQNSPLFSSHSLVSCSTPSSRKSPGFGLCSPPKSWKSHCWCQRAAQDLHLTMRTRGKSTTMRSGMATETQKTVAYTAEDLLNEFPHWSLALGGDARHSTQERGNAGTSRFSNPGEVGHPLQSIGKKKLHNLDFSYSSVGKGIDRLTVVSKLRNESSCNFNRWYRRFG